MPVVLIIADDPLAREVYGELFAMRGYGVVTAGCAREGLELARGAAVTVVVLALDAGAAQLRRRLRAVRPLLRVHVSGLLPLGFELMPPIAPRQQLH